MNEQPKLYAMLRAKGLRMTLPKKSILDVFLKNRNRMLSVGEVLSLLPEESTIDHATVYRNIQKFLDIGILKSMNDELGVNRYTVSEREHHHYLICTECGRIIKIPCEGHFWRSHAQKNRFVETHHKLEVYGKCAGCSARGQTVNTAGSPSSGAGEGLFFVCVSNLQRFLHQRVCGRLPDDRKSGFHTCVAARDNCAPANRLRSRDTLPPASRRPSCRSSSARRSSAAERPWFR